MAHILLAEADATMRRFLGERLRRAGHRVDAFADGRAAFEALGAVQYDLLLADVVMPGINGLELARRASARAPGVRVALIAGFAAVPVVDGRGRRFGDAHPVRPVHLRDLPGRIGEILAA